MPSAPATPCPSCRAVMQVHILPGTHGRQVELDLCFSCQGMWIDPQENLKLSPAAVADLFKTLHAQREAAHQPLAARVNCPRCTAPLTQGFDVVRSGRYVTYRCAAGHGRFSAFSSFMIEKGFVRQLTPAEITDIAKRVNVIHCSSCGAPVDLKKDHACTHCRSALTLLDPQAVEKALQGYAHAVQSTAHHPRVAEVAQAMVSLDQGRTAGAANTTGTFPGTYNTSGNIDLWSIGIALVAAVLK